MNTWDSANSVVPCFLPRREGLRWEASCREELRRGSALPWKRPAAEAPCRGTPCRGAPRREALRRGALPKLFHAQSSPTESADHAGAVCFPAPRALPRPARRKPLFSAQRISLRPGAAKLRPGAAKIARPAQRKSPVRRATKARPAHNEKLRQARNKKRPLPPRDKRPFCAKPRPGAQFFSCGRGGAS